MRQNCYMLLDNTSKINEITKKCNKANISEADISLRNSNLCIMYICNILASKYVKK